MKGFRPIAAASVLVCALVACSQSAPSTAPRNASRDPNKVDKKVRLFGALENVKLGMTVDELQRAVPDIAFHAGRGVWQLERSDAVYKVDLDKNQRVREVRVSVRGRTLKELENEWGPARPPGDKRHKKPPTPHHPMRPRLSGMQREEKTSVRAIAGDRGKRCLPTIVSKAGVVEDLLATRMSPRTCPRAPTSRTCASLSSCGSSRCCSLSRSMHTMQ